MTKQKPENRQKIRKSDKNRIHKSLHYTCQSINQVSQLNIIIKPLIKFYYPIGIRYRPTAI